MPTKEWLKKEFDYGYDSGNVLALIPRAARRQEEARIGGSYRRVFRKGVLPHLKRDSVVLEIGPGRGSWSRAILRHIPRGRLHTVDFQDVTRWLQPETYGGRLVCHQVTDNSFSRFEDDTFDLFWSMGVLCHNNADHIREILRNALPKMKPGGIAVHQYGDWDKLEAYGWAKGGIPIDFKDQEDDQIWWPRNSKQKMCALAGEAGWTVVTPDLRLVKRDSIIVLRRGGA